MDSLERRIAELEERLGKGYTHGELLRLMRLTGELMLSNGAGIPGGAGIPVEDLAEEDVEFMRRLMPLVQKSRPK